MLGVLGIRHVIGLTVFFLGFILQFEAHVHLASGRSTPGSSGSYFVPHAGLFRLVSSPHYLAEMILYLGTGPFPPVFCWCGDNKLSLSCWFTGIVISLDFATTSLFVYAWVVANLTTTALGTHSWYRKTFPNYPRHRRALIPWIL